MAKLRLVISPEAQRNIDEHEDFLADEAGIEVAFRFHEAFYEALNRLGEMPGVGASREWLNPRLLGLRMWPIPDFQSHIIYYRTLGEELHVLWVLHGARDRDTIIRS